MSTVPIDPQRRRLTVSQVGADQVAALSAAAADPTSEELDVAGLKELFESLEDGQRAVSISGITDQELTKKRSFNEKDSEVLVPPGQSADENVAWVRSLGLGWTCRKGMKPESPNQDSYSLLAVEKSFILLGVYDGHGAYGHDASNIARRVVVKEFIKELGALEPGKVLTDAFHTCQSELISEKSRDFSTSGTTCTMAYWDLKTDDLTVAHVGDSRAVIARRETPNQQYKTEDLSEDHKPNLEREKLRIESSDPPGRVIFDGYYNHRVFAQGSSLPGLNMSRALGDVIGHTEAGISATPDIRKINLQAERKKATAAGESITLLVCTDGVWEFITSEQAFEYIAAHATNGMQKCVDDLAKESWDAWMKDSDNEISDDITAVCLCIA
mmetsp:Transcript_23934/g.55247  ORF Transcript_23934/g.55247 Transcript_23934/m.55247 type:complete len:385 (-) Transcript_23934:55-1209(-)